MTIPAPLVARVLLIALLAARALATDVHYRLVHDPGATRAPGAAHGAADGADARAASWTVEITIRDAARAVGTLRVVLDDFGGWDALDPPYLELLEADPEPRRAEPAAGRFELPLPRRDEDVVRLSYRIALLPMHGEAQRAFGLLPTAGDSYAFGWSWNVLAQVSDDDGPVRGARTLEIVAPEGTSIVTGWAGRSVGRQLVTLAPEMGNAPIAIGTPVTETREERDGFAVEVFQLGEGSPIDDVVARILLEASPALGRLFGRPAPSPYRAFVTDHVGGGMGSHHGLRVAHTADEAPERRDSPWLAAFVLHEHIHDWLGLTVSDAGESLVWFKEGFTEYLSLWAAAASGLVPRAYFATRLLELEQIARTRSALGEVRFGDRDVRWRDGDGPIESLAYTGAPGLALLVDVTLREDGRGGLPALVAALVAEGPRAIDLDDLENAFAALGLRDLWRRSIEGTELPSTRALLERAGFAIVEQPTDLTGLGLRADGDGVGATIRAVERDGPGAAAGVRAGDVITGYFPARPDAVSARGAPTRFDFGLALLVPGQPGAFLGVRRGTQDLRLEIDPRVLSGAGAIERWGGDEKRLDAFFAWE